MSKPFQASRAWVAAAMGVLPAGAGRGRRDLYFPRERLGLESFCLEFYAIFAFSLFFKKKAV